MPPDTILLGGIPSHAVALTLSIINRNPMPSLDRAKPRPQDMGTPWANCAPLILTHKCRSCGPVLRGGTCPLTSRTHANDRGNVT
jgi:hypothetical protein